MSTPAPVLLAGWSASDAVIPLLLVAVVGGLLLVLSARRRPTAAPRQAAATPEDATTAAVVRLSRLTSVAVVLAGLALLGSAALVGLRVADGHGEETDTSAAAAVPPSIAAMGRGTAAVAPDAAAVVIGLEGSWPELGDATSRVDAAVEAAVAAGADPADVRTIAYSVTPLQDVAADGSPAGLQAVQLNYRVALSVRDLARLDGVIAAAAESGVSVFGVGIGVADPTAAAADARTRAVANARAKADQIASALGVVILHADSTEEILSNLPSSPLAVAVADPAAPPPSATGEVTIEVLIRFAVQ